MAIAYDGPLQYRMNRPRDYTPRFSPTGGYGPEMQKVSGGGPKFRSFIEKELVPFIDKSYRTIAGDRTLVGHSYGGLFASWNLVSERTKKLDARVYLAVGAFEGDSDRAMTGDLVAFAKRLKKYEGLALRSAVLDGETHNSVFPRALSDGLRFVFEGR